MLVSLIEMNGLLSFTPINTISLIIESIISLSIQAKILSNSKFYKKANLSIYIPTNKLESIKR